MLSSQSLSTILNDLGFKNIEEAALQQAELVILSKISKYKAEYSFFKNKYNSEFNLFNAELQGKSNEENFEVENDLLDWQFAARSLEKYQEQYKALQK